MADTNKRDMALALIVLIIGGGAGFVLSDVNQIPNDLYICDNIDVTVKQCSYGVSGGTHQYCYFTSAKSTSSSQSYKCSTGWQVARDFITANGGIESKAIITDVNSINVWANGKEFVCSKDGNYFNRNSICKAGSEQEQLGILVGGILCRD